MNKDIIFKPGEYLHNRIVNAHLQIIIIYCFIGDVIGSKNKSKFWTVIDLSIFELEKRSKAQNVTNTNVYLSI